MDTSDSSIAFDSLGRCDHCNNYHRNIRPNWHPDGTAERLIAAGTKVLGLLGVQKAIIR